MTFFFVVRSKEENKKEEEALEQTRISGKKFVRTPIFCAYTPVVTKFLEVSRHILNLHSKTAHTKHTFLFISKKKFLNLKNHNQDTHHIPSRALCYNKFPRQKLLTKIQEIRFYKPQ